MRHHLAAEGRDDAAFGSELLTQFARDASQAADELRQWRELGGTHGSTPSTGKGLGTNIDARLAYFATVKQRFDRG